MTRENTWNWNEKSGRQTFLAGGWHRKSTLKCELAGKPSVKKSEGLGGDTTVWQRVNIIFCVLGKKMRRDKENGR